MLKTSRQLPKRTSNVSKSIKRTTPKHKPLSKSTKVKSTKLTSSSIRSFSTTESSSTTTPTTESTTSPTESTTSTTTPTTTPPPTSSDIKKAISKQDSEFNILEQSINANIPLDQHQKDFILLAATQLELYRTQGTPENDIKTSGHKLISSIVKPQHMQNNFFFMPIIPQLRTIDELNRFLQLIDNHINPVLTMLCESALQSLTHSIDVEHIMTHVDEAKHKDFIPYIDFLGPFPTNSTHFDFQSATLINSQLQQLRIGRMTPTLLKSLYKQRVALLRGKNVVLQEDILLHTIRGSTFTDIINTIHRHLLSFAIPVASPIHPNHIPLPTTITTTTNDPPQTEEEFQLADELAKIESGVFNPYTPSITPDDLQTKLIIPKTLAATSDAFHIFYACQIIKKIQGTRPTVDPEELTVQLNTVLSDFNRAMEIQAQIHASGVRANISPLEFLSREQLNYPAWPKDLLIDPNTNQLRTNINPIPTLTSLAFKKGNMTTPSIPYFDPIFFDSSNNSTDEMTITDINVPLVQLPDAPLSKGNSHRYLSTTRIWGHRPDQQDHYIVSPTLLNGDLSLFAVFDGAGSEYCSAWLINNIIPRLKEMDDYIILTKLTPSQRKNKDLVNKILNTMILKLYPLLDDEIMEWSNWILLSKQTQPHEMVADTPQILTSASTGVIAFHHRPTGILTISHVGDSLALISVDNGGNNPQTQTTHESEHDEYDSTSSSLSSIESYIVTREHKPDQPEELIRVKTFGGVVALTGPDKLPYLDRNGLRLNMSRAFGSQNLKSVGLINTPNILNLTIPPDADDTINQDDISETFSTQELQDKYNTPQHLQLYQEFHDLSDLLHLPHDPPIRFINQSFNIKSLTLGSDGLYETIPTENMTSIPLKRFNQIKKVQDSPQYITTDEFETEQHKLPLCFIDPVFSGLKPRSKLLHTQFDSKWNSSPSDALVSEVFSKYRLQDATIGKNGRRIPPQYFPSDNITSIITFFSPTTTTSTTEPTPKL